MARSLILCFLLLLGLASPGAAQAYTLYTTPGGTGPVPCTQPNPCALKTAFDFASNTGETIQVGTGDYSSTPLTGVQTVNLPVAAGPGPRPIIVMANNYIQFTRSVSGLDVRGAVPGSDLAQFYASGTDVTVTNTGADGYGCDVIATASLSNSLCVGQNTGVRLGAQTLVNVTGIGNTGVSCGGSCTLRNVIADGASPDPNAITHDLVVESGAAIASSSAFGNATGTVNRDAGDLGVPDYQPGTFKPVSTAETIDAGTMGAGVGGVDPDGKPRTLGTAPDIGAYESARPAVVGGAATGVTETGATLNATIFANFRDTTWAWTPTNGGPAPTGPGGPATGKLSTPATLGLTGLQPGTTYTYALTANSDAGASPAATVSVTTAGTAPTGGGTGAGGSGTGGAGGATTPPPGTPTPPGAPTTPPVTLPSKLKVTGPSKAAARKLVRKGTRAKVVVACPAACSARVKGEVRAGAKRLGKLAAPAKALKPAASGKVTIRIGASKALRKRIKAYKRKHPKARLTVVLRVTTVVTGAKAPTTTLKVSAG